MHYIYYIIIIVAIFLSSCEYDTNTPIPGYITINKISLEHEKALGITDAWVYIGSGDIQGVYELPATFPILAEGIDSIVVRPGIKVNGISGTRSYYPFYVPYKKILDFKASDTITLNPISKYGDWASSIIVDDFEQGKTAFEISNKSDTIIEISESAFQGQYSGKISLDTERPSFEAYTIEQFAIPDFNDYTGMFLEMNFKCEEVIEVGLIINETSTVRVSDLIYLYPTTEWKKIYIDLYNPLIAFPEGSQIKIYLKAQLNVNSGRESAEIFVDDIKMIHDSE